MTDYVAELRHLSTYCEFEGHLNDALCDRLVCGLRSENTQKRLLAIKKLTLQEVMDPAQEMETADKTLRHCRKVRMQLSTVFLKLQTLEHPGEIQQLGNHATDVGSQITRPPGPGVGLLMQFVENVTKWAILRLYAILKRSHSQLSQATTLSLDLQGHPEHITWKQTRLAILAMTFIFLL